MLASYCHGDAISSRVNRSVSRVASLLDGIWNFPLKQRLLYGLKCFCVAVRGYLPLGHNLEFDGSEFVTRAELRSVPIDAGADADPFEAKDIPPQKKSEQPIANKLIASRS